MLRKSLHVERFNYHVTTQPTTETARHAFLTRRTHTLNSKANTTRNTRHGHTRRTSKGATRSALDLSGACKRPASCGDGGRSGCSGLNKRRSCVKSLNISRHLPGRGGGGSTERWRAAGAGLVCGTAAHHREALSATVVNLARCARLTLSQLHLGMQAGTGAQSTFEADGRPPETHLWRPLASRMSHEEGGRTPRRHTHIYCILGHLATLCRTKVRFSLCTPRDRLLVKVPRCRAYPLQVFGGRFISTVINTRSTL